MTKLKLQMQKKIVTVVQSPTLLCQSCGDPLDPNPCRSCKACKCCDFCCECDLARCLTCNQQGFKDEFCIECSMCDKCCPCNDGENYDENYLFEDEDGSIETSPLTIPVSSREILSTDLMQNWLDLWTALARVREEFSPQQ